jgi:hypothetical protein
MVHVKHWGENTQGLLRALACDTWNCTENLFWASERPGLVGAGSPSSVIRTHNDLQGSAIVIVGESWGAGSALTMGRGKRL